MSPCLKKKSKHVYNTSNIDSIKLRFSFGINNYNKYIIYSLLVYN